MEYEYGVYIFRKDLRIIDNRGLIKLSEKSKEIIPIFIFDTYQIDETNNNKNYLSYPSFRFLCESITDLSKIINKEKSELNIFYGKIDEILEKVIKHMKQKYKNEKICIGYNEDYTLYSIKRDNIMKKICKENNIDIISNDDDYTLCDMKLLIKKDGQPYKQYGAFRKNMIKNKYNKINNKKINFYKKDVGFKNTIEIEYINKKWKSKINKEYDPVEIGNRDNALKILRNLKKYKDYNENRDTLSYNTTRLSAYLNFGLISEREFYYSLKDKLGKNTQLINQIIWRDYYLCLLRYLENANSYDNHIDTRYNKLKWTKEPTKSTKSYKEWELMMKSKTGFLLIDAALEEIKKTGYMHNRCRLIVGCFSVKYLLINPLCRYIGLNDWFSRHLVDCSTSQNKLNCQWVTELDFPGKKFAPSGSVLAGRPMNISNEMIKKWDPNCIYIKKWLPHLKDVDNNILYKWDIKYNEKIHPKPIFNTKERYNEWIELCKV